MHVWFNVHTFSIEILTAIVVCAKIGRNDRLDVEKNNLLPFNVRLSSDTFQTADVRA